VYAERWTPEVLRQGDVVGEIPFPTPKLNLHGVVQATFVGVTREKIESFVVPASYRYAVVVSHDCEFNEGKRETFHLARLVRIPYDLSDEQQEKLWAFNDPFIDEHGEPKYGAIDTFVVEPIVGRFEHRMLVDFGSITPFPMTLAQQVLALKCAEMLHAEREKLRRKVAFYFGRDAEDDVAAEETLDPAVVLQRARDGLGEVG
jgi:hypothetical protein